MILILLQNGITKLEYQRLTVKHNHQESSRCIHLILIDLQAEIHTKLANV